jgi:hypothetical protein
MTERGIRVRMAPELFWETVEEERHDEAVYEEPEGDELAFLRERQERKPY